LIVLDQEQQLTCDMAIECARSRTTINM
jgi:hypothetical protein